MIPFTENRKCKLTNSDRKQISGCLGAETTERTEKKDYKGVQGTCRGGRYLCHYFCHGDNFMSLYIC